jgi:hypothetical protein
MSHRAGPVPATCTMHPGFLKRLGESLGPLLITLNRDGGGGRQPTQDEATHLCLWLTAHPGSVEEDAGWSGCTHFPLFRDSPSLIL